MATVKKFKVRVSPVCPGMVAVMNLATGDFAKQKLKSMKQVKKTFKTWLNDTEDLTFEFFPMSRLEELEKMLPDHRLSF